MLLTISLNPSLYEPYRTKLYKLVDDLILIQGIDFVGKQRGWWATNRTWKRTFGRFFPNKSPWATFVFASSAHGGEPQELCHIEVFEKIPGDLKADCIYEESVGWLHFKRFPNDMKLPGLASVLDESGRATVIRYRPGVRCTIRFDYDNGKPSVFAKVFPRKKDGLVLFNDAEMIWQTTNNVGIGAMVSQPLYWDAGTNSLWLSQVPGQPAIESLRGENGLALAEKMGCVLASLAKSKLNPIVIFGRNEQMKVTMDTARNLSTLIPSLAGSINYFLETLANLHNKVGERPLVAIHGSPHPTQWLESGQHLGLIDFDSFALGDPELDIATFLNDIDFDKPIKMMQRLEVNRAFLAGYESVFGPINQDLLSAYLAHERFNEAFRCARSVHPDGDVWAEQALGRAMVCLLASNKH